MSEVHLSCRATRHGSVGRTLNAGNAGLGWGCCCLQQLHQHSGHSSAPRRPHCPSGHTTPEALCLHRKSVFFFHGVIHSLKNAIWTTVSVQSPENVLLHHVPYLGDLFLHLFSQPGSETWLCGQQLRAEALEGMPGF